MLDEGSVLPILCVSVQYYSDNKTLSSRRALGGWVVGAAKVEFSIGAKEEERKAKHQSPSVSPRTHFDYSYEVGALAREMNEMRGGGQRRVRGWSQSMKEVRSIIVPTIKRKKAACLCPAHNTVETGSLCR